MEALGISPIQILSYIIIFFLLYFLLRGFIAKVLRTTEERKRTIEQGLKNAQEAETLKAERMREAEQEKQAMISDAYRQAGDIVDAAKTKESTIVEEAKGQANQIIADAGKEIENLKDRSKQEGLSEAREVIAMVTKKAFEGLSIDEKTEQKLVEDALKNIK